MKLVNYEGLPHVVIGEQQDWGVSTYVLATLPRRLWADKPTVGPSIKREVDPYQTKPIPTPAQLFTQMPEGESWQGMSRRSLARLEALALLAEDPQRRLDAREVETLAHQVSLVRHVLENNHLKRVLIADEVGLGKTVEAALIIKELLAANAGLRVLYLAPARLVTNVGREFRRMGLPFREWKAVDSDGNLETDDRIIASIHRAVHPAHLEKFKDGKPWDVLVVDECHHLSDWAPGGGDPVRKYRLVRDLILQQKGKGYVLLLSGTPHQANPHRFENLLRLLVGSDEPDSAIAGRVIFRTKEDVRDWDDQPLFPKRRVKDPIVCEVSDEHRQWLRNIHDFFSPPEGDMTEVRKRAAGWRCAQALQWATSSPNAGLGYLVRQAVRDGWTLTNPALRDALEAMRPYRRGPENEPIDELLLRLQKEVQRQIDSGDVEDIEDEEGEDQMEPYERALLAGLIRTGVELVRSPSQPKWEALWSKVIETAGREKIVFFAQPIETVLGLAIWLEKKTGQQPAIIIGGQSDAERDGEVARFRSADGPQFLISSKAGGEGINLQFARRLVHLDVPWNPMDMEQRIGRVHRFGSKNTILVDTLVVRNSREERMWAVARQRLVSISRTMVAPEKFETLFSRVMCLIAPEELQEIMIASAAPQIDEADTTRLSALVEKGFNNWQSFHRKYAENQRQIRKMPAGLARWEDLELYLQRHAGATRENGVTVTRFRGEGEEIVAREEPATVLRLKGGEYGLIGDYEGSPLGGELAFRVTKLGLNLPTVLEAVRSSVLPTEPVGAALLRWGEESRSLVEKLGDSLFLYIFLRQKIQLETSGGALELNTELVVFYAAEDKAPEILSDELKGPLLRALRFASTRAKVGDLLKWGDVADAERMIGSSLVKPSEFDLKERVRYSVWPLLTAHIVS